MLRIRAAIITSLFIIVGAYIIILIFSPRLLPQPKEIVVFLRQLGPIAPAVFIMLSLGRGILLFPPNVIMNLISGIVFGPIYGAIYAYIATVACALLQFGLAKLLGLPIVEQIAGKKGKLPDVTPFTTINSISLLRLVMIGVPFDLVNFGLGLTPTTWWKYLVGTTIGLMPGILLATQFGYALDQSFSPEIVIVSTLISLVATITLIYRYRRYQRVQLLDSDN